MELTFGSQTYIHTTWTLEEAYTTYILELFANITLKLIFLKISNYESWDFIGS
jgi:hypothetical protein